MTLVWQASTRSSWSMTIDTEAVTPGVDTFTVLTTGTVDYNVNWGDGNTDNNVTSNSQQHTYASPGVYTVEIFDNTGVFRPHYNNNAEGDKITSLNETKAGFPFGTTLGNAFQGSNNLTSVSASMDTSAVTIFSATWYDCSSLTSFPLIDTSSGTSFSYTWSGCSSLTSFPSINTSLVTEFSGAWRFCSGFTNFPLIDTSSGSTFVSTWFGCNGLTSFPARSGNLMNVSSGTNFNFAWYNCTSLTDFPANFFDTWTGTPATNCFASAWDNCSSLTATSVENILNSLAASAGQQLAPGSGFDITIDYNAGSGTPSVATAITNLQGRGWTITLNGVLQ